MSSSRIRSEAAIVTLACVTLTAYGSWIYSFGVLLDDLSADLGATEATLVAAFGAAQLIAGAGSLIAGRLLDRRGSRPIMLIGLLGAVVLAGATVARTAFVFVPVFALGAGIVGASGFYHISQTVVSRLIPGREAHAITRLTLYAAFSGPIFYPLSAWLVGLSGWRLVLQVGSAVTGLSFIAAWLAAYSQPTERRRTSLRHALSGHDRRAWLFAIGVILASGTIQLLSVYQVPVMTASGLALATASALAGARGIFQFFGRLPLGPIVTRMGAARSLRGAIGLLAAGTALLAGAGHVAVATAAMLVSGLGVGALSPLMGIRGTEVFPAETLGTSLGALTLGTFLSGAVTPVVAGGVVTATGTRLTAIALGTVIALIAAITVGGDR